MEKVKILESIYIEATSTKYNKGDEVEVSDALAKVHVRTGHMEIIKPDKSVKKSEIK